MPSAVKATALVSIMRLTLVVSLTVRYSITEAA